MKHKRLAALLMSSCLGLGTELAFAEEIIDVGPVPINKEAEHHFKLQPYGGSPEKFVVPQGKIYTTTSKTWNHALYGFV